VRGLIEKLEELRLECFVGRSVVRELVNDFSSVRDFDVDVGSGVVLLLAVVINAAASK
jgi:hypothetical protein